MAEPRLVVAAIDQGSSSTKGALVSADGQRSDEISLAVETAADGASIRHDPRELAASVEQVLEHLLDRHRVDAIGLTCQRSTCLLWDRDTGEPLTAALSWQDTSQSERVASLASSFDLVRGVTGLRLSPHYAASKIAAMLDELPHARQRAERGEIVAGTLDAYLARHLTGKDGTEPGHAGRTLLFDLESGSWSPQLADLFGIPISALPPLRPSAGSLGSFRGVPVTAIAGDQQAALIGHGGWTSNVSAVHFGTGAFILAATGNRLIRDPAVLVAVLASTADSTTYQVEATVNSAGSAVDWAVRLGNERLPDWQSRELDPDALPLVLPAFRGIGAPWWNPDARAVVSKLDTNSSAADILAGTLAGVAMRVLDCVELLDSITPVEKIRASGKLTRLRGLTGLLADGGQLPVETVGDEEVGLLGIGRLAIAGLTDSEDALAGTEDPIRKREPRWSPERARSVRQRWKAFVESALGLGTAP